MASYSGLGFRMLFRERRNSVVVGLFIRLEFFFKVVYFIVTFFLIELVFCRFFFRGCFVSSRGFFLLVYFFLRFSEGGEEVLLVV